MLAALMLLAAMPVYAGVMETVQEHAISGALTLLFGLIAAVFGSRWAKLKAPVMAVISAIYAYKDAKETKSDGGSKITPDEWNRIYAHLSVALDGLIAAIPSSWLPARKAS
jgi:hypothetical protein